jgi:hypothetical protein
VLATALFAEVSVAGTVAAGDPVVLVHGACPDDGCTMAVSRQQLEELMNILSPSRPVTPGVKRSLATTYAELLTFDSAARALGIDHSSQYQSAIRWFEAKTLADLLRRRLEIEASKVTEEEIQNYYRKYASRFEVVTLRRLALPKNSFAAEDNQKFEQDARRVAAKLRERAIHGEDLEWLQKDAFEALGFSGMPPATQVGNRRRTDLSSAASEAVFSLQPGGVSEIENEPYSFVIYKVDAKWTTPIEQVREEIARKLAEEKLERALKSISGGIRTELNENYFGTDSGQ